MSSYLTKAREVLLELTEVCTDDIVALARSRLDSTDEHEKAVWSRAFMNDLPDSSFLYIEPGGKKDGEGKTVPRSLRHFPVRGPDGKLDLPHVRNAISRIPQAKIPGLSQQDLDRLQDKARKLLDEMTKAAAPTSLSKVFAGRKIPVVKTVEERFVLGIVLEPDEVDSQNDTYNEDEVRAAAHWFMENGRHRGLMHRYFVDKSVIILESYIAPVDFEIEGEKIKKGTWLLAERINDDKIWAKIKSGEYTGFSIGGSAFRENPFDWE